jgi:hypothetical protein
LFFSCPAGDFVFVEAYNFFEFTFDLGLRKSCVFVGFLVAGIYLAEVRMVSVEVSDEGVCELSGVSIGVLEPVDIVVSDEPTVEVEKLVEFLVHFVDVSGFNDFFKVFDDGYHVLFPPFLF